MEKRFIVIDCDKTIQNHLFTLEEVQELLTDEWEFEDSDGNWHSFENSNEAKNVIIANDFGAMEDFHEYLEDWELSPEEYFEDRLYRCCFQGEVYEIMPNGDIIKREDYTTM